MLSPLRRAWRAIRDGLTVRGVVIHVLVIFRTVAIDGYVPAIASRPFLGQLLLVVAIASGMPIHRLIGRSESSDAERRAVRGAWRGVVAAGVCAVGLVAGVAWLDPRAALAVTWLVRFRVLAGGLAATLGVHEVNRLLYHIASIDKPRSAGFIVLPKRDPRTGRLTRPK